MTARDHSWPKNRQLGTHYIRDWRQHRGLSLRKLAARMEREPGTLLMSFANLGRIENFEQPYSQEVLEALALALDCSVSDLLSVNPKKDGKVVDLMRLINDNNRDQIIKIIQAISEVA